MAHVVLPQSSGRAAAPAKFADQAVRNLVAEFKRRGSGRNELVAKMAGGASVFGDSGPMGIGPANAAAVRRASAAAGISLAADRRRRDRGPDARL